ncbi:MAG: hypothetical protein KAT05_10755, partial [Spirochaetes bacterium]|nr:hypothetical protein [Spirochaetota bacterium]
TTPYVTYNMDGTILDYNAFGEMQDKIKLYKNKQANKEAIEKDNIKKDLYIYIDNIKNTDASKDDVEIDYMHLLPLFSEQIPVSQISDKKDEYKYNKVLIGDEDFTYKEEDVSDVDVTKEDEDKEAYRSKYFKISQINPNKQETSGIVKPIYFNLAYSLKEKITNTFSFDTTTDEAKYDTIQTLFKGNLDIDNIVKRFSVVNDLSFTLSGSLKLFEISGKSLWNMSPKLYINYNKYYDNMDIFKGDEKIQLTENARKSDFSIKYADSITNDLSFGVYRIAGTMIKTNLKINIFKFNELKQYNFSLLNSDNEGNETYEEYKDTHFYYNRVTYEKIETFQTTLTLSFNLLPEGNPHKLSMGIGPFVKWVIPSSDLSTLKNELWAKASGDVTTDGNNDILNEAKEYIYYRSKGLNLNDKINDFFWGKDFWIGAKYYRKMLSNFTYSLKYSYTKNSITVVDISNSLIFKLENIGVFSNLSGLDRYHSVFPDDTFNISFFNQMIKYTLGIAFKKVVNNKAFDNLDDYDKKLDEYNIITMTKAHTFNFKIPGTLFKAKLPTGDWLSLSTILSFKWDRTLSTRDESTDRVESNWDDKSEYNYFFLDSQTIQLYLLMNIFYIELKFKSFNFTGTGYGFELDNGKIDIGYKITQIPIFWRFFKLTFEPKVSYNFVVKHNQYYDGSTLKEFNTSYYSNNKLSFSLNVDLVIGEGTKFETKIHFGVSSENKKIYRYYTDTGVKDFFVDLGKSFRFDDIQLRRDSPFNLSLVVFSITHKLCDWELNFKYMGQPEKDSNTNKYNWENTFEFTVEWKIDTKNQLMKMFNKSNIKEVYQRGEWEQPVVSLDPDD